MPKLPKHVERVNGRYYYRRQVNGRRIPHALGPYLSDARTKAAAYDRQYDHWGDPQFSGPGQKMSQPGQTVSQFATERWIPERIRPARNAAGIALAEQRLRDHIEPVIGSLGIDQVRRGDLYRIRSRSRDHGLSPCSVRHVLSDVRCLLYFAHEVEAIPIVPSFRRILPVIPRSASKHLTADQVTRILDAASPPHRLAIRIGLLTGLRFGEIHRLQWRDLDLSQRRLTVREAKDGEPRHVPLSPEAVEMFREAKREASSVFVLPFRQRNACNWVGRIGKRAGFKWNFHQTRHTFGRWWLDSGGSKKALSTIYGHSTIRLVEEVYGTETEDWAADEMERITGQSGQGMANPR